MEKQDLIQSITDKCKLVRVEYGFSQDQMANVIGISKKSLVESEKGRRLLNWTECVTLCTIFSQSQVLQNAFGGELSDMIKAIAFENTDVTYPMTMGGKIWWKVIEEMNGYRIQQNILSQHYRLLDPKDGRMISSFDLDEIRQYMKQIGIEGSVI
ncbi:MAG: hypothetical protein IKR11_09170 [Solobacterium sp.]|nr:hypothetical protein [Solobacterium sp.]